jgi:hypothetical protein
LGGKTGLLKARAQDPTSGLHRLADARWRLSEKGAILVIILQWAFGGTALHPIMCVSLDLSKSLMPGLTSAFSNTMVPLPFARPADCSLPTRYLLYQIAATNGPHRAIIE